MGSVPGPYHIQKDLPNQDAILFHEDRGLMLAAVADGAGSLKHSDEGAYIAALTAVETMEKARKNLDFEKLVEYALFAAREELFKKENFKAYGCTLTVAAWDVEGNLSVGSIGDSFAVAKLEDGSYELVSAGGSGEYANITELLTSEDPTPVIASFENVTGLALSSDGLESVAIQDKAAHAGFWEGIFSKAEAGNLDVDKLFRWLDSLDRLVDDTSLLTIVKR